MHFCACLKTSFCFARPNLIFIKKAWFLIIFIPVARLVNVVILIKGTAGHTACFFCQFYEEDYNCDFLGDNKSYVEDSNSYAGDNKSYVGVTNTYVGDNKSYVEITFSYKGVYNRITMRRKMLVILHSINISIQLIINLFIYLSIYIYLFK